MPLDAQIPLMVRPPEQPISPFQSIGALMQMRGQASEIALRQAQMQNYQAQEQERQRKIQDETNLKKIVSDTFLNGGGWDDAFDKATRSGIVSPDAVLAAKKNYGAAVEQQAKTDTETLKNHQSALATLTPAAQSILDNVDPAQRQSQYQSLLQNSANSDNPSIRKAVAGLPKTWDDQTMKELIAQSIGAEKMLDHSLAVQKAKQEAQQKTITTDQGIMGFNAETGKYDIPQGQPLEKKTMAAPTITTADGLKQWNPATQRYDIDAGEAPSKEPDTTDLKNYKFAQTQGYKGTFQQWQTDEANRKKSGGEGVGTWQLQEDTQGNTVEYNTKTGQVRPAPNVRKAGTAAAQEKLTGPVRDAVDYATTYLNSGAFTGSGDEALLEKFFETAKPSTGFRMTQPQMAMLQNSRSWMGSLEAKARHALTGKWFSDEQRQEIVKTMNDLAGAKLRGQGVQSAGSSPGSVPDAVKSVLSNAPAGKHTLSDGSVWVKKADGTITQ